MAYRSDGVLVTINWNAFAFSNNWWIEDDKAWFVNGTFNILFCVDIVRKKCELAVRIPDPNPNTYRLNPFCAKQGKTVFCIPGIGESIWVYNLECQNFTQIAIDNPGKMQLSFHFYLEEGRIFAVPLGKFGKIVEINIEQKRIVNYYTICEKDNIADNVVVGSVAYILSGESNQVYRFGLSDKSLQILSLPEVKGKLCTICFDGKKFWLSGYRKEAYVWCEENNTLVTIGNFPQGFGIYNFDEESKDIIDYRTEEFDVSTFGYSVAAGQYIWFIPFLTNKIIYVDQINYKVYTFEIEEESETKKSLLRKVCVRIKYVLVYVRDNRYIGLFSSKNNQILEIDAKELKYQWHDYDFSGKCLELFGESAPQICKDNLVWDRVFYSMQIRAANCNSCNRKRFVGGEIHKSIMAGELT